jgi:transposase
MEPTPSLSDVSEDEWALVAPYLTRRTDEAPPREHRVCEVLNGLRWLVRAGVAWCLRPQGLPSWYTVYQRHQRWRAASVFDAIVHALRHSRRLSSIVIPCHRPPKAAGARTMMGPNTVGPRKCIGLAVDRRGPCD